MKPTTASFAPPAVFALALSLTSPWALADANDTFNIIPSVNWLYDSNIFRQSSDAAIADHITTASLMLKVDKTYSLQRFELEASYVDYRYQTNTNLSYDTTPYKAAWRWSLTPYVHGNLSTDSVTTSYDDPLNVPDPNNVNNSITTNKRILTTNENTRFDGIVDLSASWHVLAGVSEYTHSNSEVIPSQGLYNYTIKRAEAGLRHTFSTGSTLSYVARSGRGEYFDLPQGIGTSIPQTAPFDETENELRLLWSLTAKTNVNARIAHLQRKYDDSFSSSDYSGNAGNLDFNWIISGKSKLSAALARELAGNPSSNTNYAQTDRFTLTPLWQISNKTALRARLSYAQRDYRGTPGPGPASDRHDTLRNNLIAFDWQPLRTATISATLQNEKLDSNQSGNDYDRNMVGVSALISF